MHAHVNGCDAFIKKTWDLFEQIMLQLHPMPNIYMIVEHARYLKLLNPAGRIGHPTLPTKRKLLVDHKSSTPLLFSSVAMKALQMNTDDDGGTHSTLYRTIKEV